MGKKAFITPYPIVRHVSGNGYLNANNTRRIVAPKVIKALLSPDMRRNPNRTIRKITGVEANRTCNAVNSDTGFSTLIAADKMIIRSMFCELLVNF